MISTCSRPRRARVGLFLAFLVLCGSLLVAAQAVASEIPLPVTRTVDESYFGKPDDPGHGVTYLEPQSSAGFRGTDGAQLSHHPQELLRSWWRTLMQIIVRWRTGA